MRADGSDERPERLVRSGQRQIIQSWSPQGHIAYIEDNDIWVLPPDGVATPFFTSDARESYAVFSPDNRWVAYLTKRENSSSGDLYVRPYPGPGRATLVASGRNTSPAWSHDGTRLYFLSHGDRIIDMMEVDIEEGVPSAARQLISPWPYTDTTDSRSYEVLEDGSFIVASRAELSDGEISEAVTFYDSIAVTEVQVILNFFELLRERLRSD